MTLYTWSKTAPNNSTADSTINWAEGQSPSSVNDSARATMAAVAKFRDDNNGSITTGGTSTAYTTASNQIFDSLAHLDKQTLTVTFHATCGTAPTLNVDSLGAKAINSSDGVAVPSGSLLANTPYDVVYNNGSNEFIVRGQLGVLPTSLVTTAAIAAKTVTYPKIQDISVTQRVLGKNSAGSGTTEEVTLSQLLDWIGAAAQGDILYRDTSTWARLPAASVVKAVLQSGGAGANPSWTSAQPAGPFLLNTLTASGSASLSDTTSITNPYFMYEIVFQNIVPATAGISFLLQVHSGGAYQTTSYVNEDIPVDTALDTGNISPFTTAICIGHASRSQNTGVGLNGRIRVYAPTGTTAPKMWLGETAHNQNSGSTLTIVPVAGMWNANGALDGFQFLMSSGNITSGTIKVYGIV